MTTMRSGQALAAHLVAVRNGPRLAPAVLSPSRTARLGTKTLSTSRPARDRRQPSQEQEQEKAREQRQEQQQQADPPRLLSGLFSTAAAFAACYVAFNREKLFADSATPSASAGMPDQRACLVFLRRRFDKQLSEEETDLEVHGASPWSYHAPAPPLAILYPQSAQDVIDLVRICVETRTPIVPYAGGTSLEAHAALKGAVCVDWRDMSKVLSVNAEDGDVHVEPGLRYEDLNAHLQSLGLQLFFPVDPGPGAQIGGMCASGGSGTNAVRYGTMKGDYILSLDVVLPSGELISTRSRARKSSAGPDLTKLFLGSEGTLGLIVGARLRLAPLLPISVACLSFPSVEKAVSAAHALLNTGANVQCVELLDEAMIEAINATEQSRASHPLKPTLFIKFAGTDAHRREDERLLGLVGAKYGADKARFEREEAQMEELWSARKQALWAALDYAGEGKRCWTTDVCVPISKLPLLVKRVKQQTKEAGIYGPIVGHVGDGNVHSLLMFDETKPEEIERVKQLVYSFAHAAQSLGGTCTGEHGIGRGKRDLLEQELGKGTVELLGTLKRTLDPFNIMNPGALYPDNRD